MNTSLKNQRFMRSWTLPIRPSRSATSRCNRELGKRFGDQAYAMEELVAELGAAFLCADLQITDEPRADHAQYLASWLSIMKGDKADALKARCVLAEVRWRWTLKVSRAAACVAVLP